MGQPHHYSRRRHGRLAVRVFACAAFSALLGLTGCSSAPKILTPEKKQPDPILGEVHPQNTPNFGPAPPERSKQSSSAAPASLNRGGDDPLFPALPTSNAALASRTQHLPGSQPLAIADRREPGPFQLTGGGPTVRPVPRDPALANGDWATPLGQTSTGSAGGNFGPSPSNFVEPSAALLQSRGVTSHRLDPLADGTVRLTAIVPRRDNPNRQITYEAVAADFASAAAAVVAQIDQRR